MPEVVLEGPDRGMLAKEPRPPGPTQCAAGESTSAGSVDRLPDEWTDLSRDHGYPVRAIVPGHYGMASVKWLTPIQAVREPFQGYWQTSSSSGPPCVETSRTTIAEGEPSWRRRNRSGVPFALIEVDLK
jgi:hypothetical protein